MTQQSKTDREKQIQREIVQELISKYNLTQDDIFIHKNYVIVNRRGIEEIQHQEKIRVEYQVVNCHEHYAALQAFGYGQNGIKVETFASALYGKSKLNETTKKWEQTGNTAQLYVLELAEKRALSRVVLKMIGMYKRGVFGEDETSEFKPKQSKKLN